MHERIAHELPKNFRVPLPVLIRLPRVVLHEQCDEAVAPSRVPTRAFVQHRRYTRDQITQGHRRREIAPSGHALLWPRQLHHAAHIIELHVEVLPDEPRHSGESREIGELRWQHLRDPRTPNVLAAELRAEGPSAPAACSPAAGVEHAALRREHVPPDRLRSGGTTEIRHGATNLRKKVQSYHPSP